MDITITKDVTITKVTNDNKESTVIQVNINTKDIPVVKVFIVSKAVKYIKDVNVITNITDTLASRLSWTTQTSWT